MVSYSNVDDMLDGYKIKFALPYKIFSTLIYTFDMSLKSLYFKTMSKNLYKKYKCISGH